MVFPFVWRGARVTDVNRECKHGDLVPCLTVEWRSRTPRWFRPQNKSQNQTALSAWWQREQCWRREGKYLNKHKHIFYFLSSTQQKLSDGLTHNNIVVSSLGGQESLLRIKQAQPGCSLWRMKSFEMKVLTGTACALVVLQRPRGRTVRVTRLSSAELLMPW